MAFPTIPTAGAGRILTTNQADTSGTRTFPSLSSLTKNSGDLLIAVIVAYQTSTGTNAAFSSWGGGFTEFHDSATSTTLAIGCAYKISDGTETGTFTVTQAATITGHASMILMSIPGAHASSAPEAGSRASGTTGAADPASFNPSWNAEDLLWIAVGGNGMTSGTGSWTGVASAPANFTDYVDTATTDNSTVGQTEAAVAFRQLIADSLDVGTFSHDTSNARNGAVVIAVRPVASTSAVTVTDTFTRSDSDTVGNDSNGNAWVERSGDWDISSNGVIQTDAQTNPGCLLCGTDTATSTHWVEAELAASDGTGQVGLIVRLDATAFTGLSFEVADGNYKLIEVSAGSPNTVFTGSAHSHTTGELYAVEIDSANNIRLYLDGTQVASTTSSFNIGDTRVGLHINESNSGAIRWDNFRAGTGAYPGPPATTVQGSGVGAYTFTSTAAGVPETFGVAAGSFTFGSTASGVPDVQGQAAAAVTFTGTGSGTVGSPGVQGAGNGDYTFTGAAAGVPETFGAAQGAYTFTSTGAGVDRALGVAAAPLGFTGTGSGVDRALGAAAASLGFTGTAAGVPETFGTGSGLFSFTGTASGFAGTPPVTGQATGAYTFTSTAAGVDRALGQAASTFGFTAGAAGVPEVIGAAVLALALTATAAGSRETFAQAVAAIVFAATGGGFVGDLPIPAGHPVSVPASPHRVSIAGGHRVTAPSRPTVLEVR